jgi:hypothetical protein
MATSADTSNLKNPWAWLAGLVALGLVLASSTALYMVKPGVKLPLPWWAAVAAPVLFYALVLPLCVPRIRIGGWLTGILTLAVLHVGIGLATAWLYAMVGLTTFEQALAPALWAFPPAIVLAMVGALVMTLPFLGRLAPRATAPRARAPRAATPRLQAEAVPARPAMTKRPGQVPETIPAKNRKAWARPSAAAQSASAVAAAATQTVNALPATAVAAPALDEPPVAAPDEPTPRGAALLGVEAGASPMAQGEAPSFGILERKDLLPTAAPDFREALTEFFGAPAAETRAKEVLEPVREPGVDELGSPRDTETSELSENVVRIPFDRVMGQLPPGAFRVPLGQVGARLREAETLVVPQAVIVPQLGEGVVQIEWELVAEQFPAAVLAVASAEVKERIVNGRLLLPLDEIVRQLPPDVFAASMGRVPLEVSGLESFPEPFKPLEWKEPLSEPAGAGPRSATNPVPPAAALAVQDPQAARIEASVPARTPETGALSEPQMGHPESGGDAEELAALLAPWKIAALDEVQVGDVAIISVSLAGLTGSAVATAAGRLSPLIARRAPLPVDQATLRGVGGTLVLTPVGSGWSTATALAVGLRPGGALARLEILARRAAATRLPASPPADLAMDVAPAVRLDAASPPAASTVAAEDLEAFGPLTAQSYREPTSGALIHSFVSPGAPAAELAAFAWELAQAMAQGTETGALGPFHSAVLRSGTERLEIHRLSSATGPAAVLVVAGAETGRPGLAHLQVERVAARLGGI